MSVETGLCFTAEGPVHAVGAAWRDPLDRHEWVVHRIRHREALRFIAEHHYARGGPNTSVVALGLYHRGGGELLGAALWLPPIIAAARHVAPSGPHGVLGLSRLAVHPSCPKNAASFLVGGCIALLPDRYPVLLTFADEAFGHVGGIYQATNWGYAGATRALPVWRRDGRVVSPKRGPVTLRVAAMRAEGAEVVQRARKHRYVLDRRVRLREHPVYPKRGAALAVSR